MNLRWLRFPAILSAGRPPPYRSRTEEHDSSDLRQVYSSPLAEAGFFAVPVKLLGVSSKISEFELVNTFNYLAPVFAQVHTTLIVWESKAKHQGIGKSHALAGRLLLIARDEAKAVNEKLARDIHAACRTLSLTASPKIGPKQNLTQLINRLLAAAEFMEEAISKLYADRSAGGEAVEEAEVALLEEQILQSVSNVITSLGERSMYQVDIPIRWRIRSIEAHDAAKLTSIIVEKIVQEGAQIEGYSREDENDMLLLALDIGLVRISERPYGCIERLTVGRRVPLRSVHALGTIILQKPLLPPLQTKHYYSLNKQRKVHLYVHPRFIARVSVADSSQKDGIAHVEWALDTAGGQVQVKLESLKYTEKVLPIGLRSRKSPVTDQRSAGACQSSDVPQVISEYPAFTFLGARWPYGETHHRKELGDLERRSLSSRFKRFLIQILRTIFSRRSYLEDAADFAKCHLKNSSIRSEFYVGVFELTEKACQDLMDTFALFAPLFAQIHTTLIASTRTKGTRSTPVNRIAVIVRAGAYEINKILAATVREICEELTGVLRNSGVDSRTLELASRMLSVSRFVMRAIFEVYQNAARKPREYKYKELAGHKAFSSIRSAAGDSSPCRRRAWSEWNGKYVEKHGCAAEGMKGTSDTPESSANTRDLMGESIILEEQLRCVVADVLSSRGERKVKTVDIPKKFTVNNPLTMGTVAQICGSILTLMYEHKFDSAEQLEKDKGSVLLLALDIGLVTVPEGLSSSISRLMVGTRTSLRASHSIGEITFDMPLLPPEGTLHLVPSKPGEPHFYVHGRFIARVSIQRGDVAYIEWAQSVADSKVHWSEFSLERREVIPIAV